MTIAGAEAAALVLPRDPEALHSQITCFLEQKAANKKDQ